MQSKQTASDIKEDWWDEEDLDDSWRESYLQAVEQYLEVTG